MSSDYSEEETISLDSSLFESEVFEEYDFQFGDHTIKINGQHVSNQHTQSITGLLLWPASHTLCYYLLKNAAILDNENYVLELGSGVGMCGILCGLASSDKTKVILTDYDDKVLSLLQKNIDLNFKKDSLKCKVEQLEWGNEKSIFDFEFQYPFKFDLIIGSDLVYVQSSVDPLFFTLKRLLSQTGKFILSFVDRCNHFPHLMSVSIKYDFDCELIDLHSFLEEIPSPPPRLLIFTLKK